MGTEPRYLRAQALHLHGRLAHWAEVAGEPWVDALIRWEAEERQRRRLERRLAAAHLGRFKPACDFDWAWPKRGDRAALEARMTLDFLQEAANVVLIGPNGVGKSMWAQNLAHPRRCSTAPPRSSPPPAHCSANWPPATATRRHADLLFEPVSRRYQAKSTLVTTHRPFAEWHEVFPNAAGVVSLIDRLIHNAEVIAIDGDSYRLKEAKERTEQRARRRRQQPEDTP